jgi:flagellar hook-associated protein 3 FlgL
MVLISTSTSAFYDRSTVGMADLRTQAEALQQQIATGQKLSKASDNPLAASQLRSLARTEQLSQVDAANASRASSDLQLADTTLSSFADYITRAQELATQAASGTLDNIERAGIATELQQIRGNLIALANARDSAGHTLFGGEATGDAYTLDASGNASYVGTATSPDVALGDGQTVRRGMTGPEFLSFTVNGNPTDLLAQIKALGDALAGGAADPAQAARDALDALGAGLDKVTTAQTVVGARMAWIDLTGERRTNLSELNSSEEADIGSTDNATAIARLQQLTTVLEASQAAFSKLANLSLFSLIN